MVGQSGPQFGYRRDIDGLRAIAVLSVVAFHADAHRLPGGFIGVDVFFVISGYLISHLLLAEVGAGGLSLSHFYARRIRRLFPALATMSAVALAIGWRILPSHDFAEMGKQIVAGSVFAANLAFWQEAGYFDVDAHLKPMLHLWSLGVEEQFYIFWPLLLFWVWRRKISQTAVIAVILVASFVPNLIEVKQSPVVAFYSPFTRFWELMLGCLAAAIENGAHSSKTPRWPSHAGSWPFARSIASLVGLLLIVAGLCVINPRVAFPGAYALLPTTGAVLILAAGPGAWLNRHVLALRPLVWVGKISYPLYLWHWVLLVLLTAASIPTRNSIAAIVALSFLLAWLTYVGIERPIRRAAPGKLPVVVPLAALCLVSLAALLVYASHGVPSRFSEEANRLSPPPTDASYRYKACFVDTEHQDEHSFSPQCWDPGHEQQTLVLLWGDSHAAHLYPGLHKLQATVPFRLAQLTATGCSPLIGVSKSGETCERVGAFVRGEIMRLRPAVVILGDRWSRDGPAVDAGLRDTVAFLRENGVKKVFMVGSPPRWDPTLSTALFWFYRQHAYVPRVMPLLPDELTAMRESEKRLKAIASANSVSFISAADVLCKPEGCMTLLGDPPEGLVSPDYDHFTAQASEFFIDAVYKDGALRW